MSLFAILLAGPVRATPALIEAVSKARVIAADRGLGHAAPLGVVPELWVGDFDSAGAEITAAYPHVPRETFPRDKDRTDGEIAIEAAIERGATRILLVGALGGPRSDHAFMHLILALRYQALGLAIELFDGRERAMPLALGTTAIDCAVGTTFSILKFTDLTGLTIEGAKWPLHEVKVPFASILTQSNEAAGLLSITLATGTALVVLQVENELD